MLDLRFLYGFYRREERSDEILIEWDRDVDILVTVFLPPHFGREECCLTPSFGSSDTGVI